MAMTTAVSHPTLRYDRAKNGHAMLFTHARSCDTFGSMNNWKKHLLNTAVSVETDLDNLKRRLALRLHLNDPLMIQPYYGYGTDKQVTLQGRVLENEGVTPPMDDDTLWHNVLNAYRQLDSDEVAGAVVKAQFQGQTHTAVTDEEGYFTFNLQPAKRPSSDRLWHNVDLTLLSAPGKQATAVTATGHVLIPPSTAQYGVISDIDDTVLQSSATNYLRAARLIFLQNARTRLPFSGVSAFYQALQQGNSQNGNPIFYVSSSPWNLFLMLTEFFKLQNIPQGPLCLKDYGLSKEHLFTSGHRQHKVAQIEKILTIYPNLPFILIGDSGQKDPEIYAEIAENHPHRILAIYIRDVSEDNRDLEVMRIADETTAVGIDMLLVPDSLAAADHAVRRGWIDPQTLPAIAQEKTADLTKNVDLAQLD